MNDSQAKPLPSTAIMKNERDSGQCPLPSNEIGFIFPRIIFGIKRRVRKHGLNRHKCEDLLASWRGRNHHQQSQQHHYRGRKFCSSSQQQSSKKCLWVQISDQDYRESGNLNHNYLSGREEINVESQGLPTRPSCSRQHTNALEEFNFSLGFLWVYKEIKNEPLRAS